MSEIQRKICNYLRRFDSQRCDGLDQNTVLCFVGMLETGEATPDDFDRCRIGLGEKVVAHKSKLDAKREAGK